MTEVYQLQIDEFLNRLIENTFQLRSEYRRITEYFGPINPLTKLAESQERSVFRLLQLFWFHGKTPPHDVFLHSGKCAVILKRALSTCLNMEKKNLELCQNGLSQTDEPLARRIISNIRSATQNFHLPILQHHMRKESEGMSSQYLPNISTSRHRFVTLGNREFKVKPGRPVTRTAYSQYTRQHGDQSFQINNPR